MISNVNRLSWRVGLVVLGLAGQAVAAAAPSENATINLIRLLVQQGVLKQDQADGLIAQAEREAVQAARPPRRWLRHRWGRPGTYGCNTCRTSFASRSAIR